MHLRQRIYARLITLVVAYPVFGHAAKGLAEIIQLRAEADFRSVKLEWEYPKHGANFYAFQVHYCELQAWGPNRCRNKIVDESEGVESQAGKKFRSYSVTISPLRMAINYSFEVRPLQTRHNSQYAKDFGKTIIVPTNGFSAKANLCLPDVSEVEVSTGPYFGGRIAVESSNGGKADNCSVEGDATSDRDTYILRIEHKPCGSSVNRTTVSTFIIVQETLPILTHSTRRFVVLCTFQPETLTVRAGINIPHTSTGSFSGTTASSYRGDIPLSNEILGNDIQAASLRLMNDHTNYGRNFKGEDESHYIIVAVVLLISVVGLGLTLWWIIPLKSIAFNSKHSSDSGVSSIYENYTNSIIDTVSVTDIDFGNIINESSYENSLKSEASNPTLTDYRVPLDQCVDKHILNLILNNQSHSEA